MNVEAPILAIVLTVFFLLDGIACAIPIAFVKNDLDRLKVPMEVQQAIPIVKFAAFAGLLLGLWVPILGAITAAFCVLYFFLALGFHKQGNDPVAKYVPAFALMIFSGVVLVVSYIAGI